MPSTMEWMQIISVLSVPVGAVLLALAALLQAKAKKILEGIQKDVLVLKEDVVAVKSNVVTIEKATNSMKDALVEATARASQAEGEKKGREDQRLETKHASQKGEEGVVVSDPVAHDKLDEVKNAIKGIQKE